MKITVIAVGKLKEKFWKDAIEEYSKRLSSYCNLNIIEVADVDSKSVGGQDAEKAKEGSAIISKFLPNSYKIALVIEAKELSSTDFASYLDNLKINGNSHICFVIGGSCGISDDVIKSCDAQLSLGKITLPHNLARVVLLEQIYRAFTITEGKTYHK